ncbi:unnamed protein product [Rangifer tarandus platyrhynchus]|uniref:Uncharacterized protein n=1 Tax=Rangifer tarandus platyrhynchus TaxID=3082113 RepID=A0ABN8Z262_RANTA|nr:unnamed protein product [Rangifer tarandus platyrhynchus]
MDWDYSDRFLGLLRRNNYVIVLCRLEENWAGASHGLCPHITPGDPLVTEEIAEPTELPFVNGPTLRKVETWTLRAW